METFHSNIMEQFRACVQLEYKRGTEWFRFLFGWDQNGGKEWQNFGLAHLFHSHGEYASHKIIVICKYRDTAGTDAAYRAFIVGRSTCCHRARLHRRLVRGREKSGT
jgi:hypothetical protein